MPRNDIEVKNAKSITLDGKTVIKIEDDKGNVLWQKLSPHTDYCRIMFVNAFNSGSEFFLPLKSNN